MAYSDHFKHADDVIAHLDSVVPSISDPLLKAKYSGFVAIAAVTVFELAVKEIFIEFAKKKHKILGNFTENYFDRINGRIKVQVIQNDYIMKFGNKYNLRFKKRLEKSQKNYLALHHRDIRSAYGNLVTWRNDFAHEGRINTTATYDEVVQAYNDGKEIIHCLAMSMTR